MKFVRTLSPLFMMLALATASAVAQTAIYSPANGSQVGSPFTLNMKAATCSGQPVSAVGYSLDNSAQAAVFQVNYMNGPVSTSAGWHVLHVKVWNMYGGFCPTDLSIDVVPGASATGSSNATSVIPSNAIGVGAIQTMGGWTMIHDGGTPGSSAGAMSVTGSPAPDGKATYFQNVFNYYGGERYAVQFATDTAAQNFFYDTYVYIANDSNGISNLEFDLAQTMQNGQTVMMGFQCDTWNNTWDYSVNGGSPTQFNDTWAHSSAYCNVHNWAPNAWHHVQIWYTRNTSGWVTYHAVWLDGAQQAINVTAFSGYSLGWGPAVITQFQIDGASSGTSWGNVYLDGMAVYRW
ncbi:MAG TPA: hypothetical protein VHE33_20045 [Acidobacteriaceae bacterium]|nr:hypothetical protein [Acidobacteriaceae bacterium]